MKNDFLFLPGVRVTYTSLDSFPLAMGATGTVVKDDSGETVLVKWDDFDDGHDGDQIETGSKSYWWVTADELAVTPSVVETVAETSPLIRTFASGASRDTDANKLDFEAFLSPLVLQRYAEYMHSKRKMADGSLRDGDNWQKGIPKDVYMKSTARHWQDLWLHHRGLGDLAVEDELPTVLALLFNVSGIAHTLLTAEREQA